MLLYYLQNPSLSRRRSRTKSKRKMENWMGKDEVCVNKKMTSIRLENQPDFALNGVKRAPEWESMTRRDEKRKIATNCGGIFMMHV